MFCVKCGQRLADNAMFCINCGNKVAPEQPVSQETTVMQEPVVTAPPVVEVPVVQETVATPPVIETPVVEAPIVETPIMETVAIQQTEAPTPVQQNAYDQRQYTHPGSFQSVQQAPQQMYQPQQPVMQQAFYNTPAQSKKKGNVSIPAILFLVIATITAMTIAISNFIDGKVGMGVMNICYSVTSIILMVYCVSEKKIGSILKGVFFVIMLILNVIFAGFSAFGASFDIFGNAKAGIDYYYAVVLLLQYISLYVYMLVSIIRSFMGKEKTSYATCLVGYFAILLVVAAFIIDVVSDINNLFAFGFIPIDLGLVALIAGDLFATTKKGKNKSK